VGRGKLAAMSSAAVGSNSDPSRVRHERLARVRSAMVEHGVDALLLSLGADLPWLTGYEAMPLERLTMLVVPLDDEPTLVVPRLEAARVSHDASLFAMRPWGELEDPVAITAGLIGSRTQLAIADRAWATFLVGLQRELPKASWTVASSVTGPIRAVKDAAEVEALARAGAAADRVAAQLHAGEIPLIGRTESAVSADISARLIAEGHDVVNFAIVAAGENAASPHHHPGDRVIQAGEVVLTDFGGTMAGYCSDITRCVNTGAIPVELADVYSVLKAAQAAGVAAGVVGSDCQSVDRASRQVINDAGYGEYFIHRTGHGIGMEAHEDPYMVEGNSTAIAAGHAYSVEPGVYIEGRFGFRLEDIVVATVNGPRSLNHAMHDLVVVEA
jgi:Xaa-Pro aminopeptidase